MIKNEILKTNPKIETRGRKKKLIPASNFNPEDIKLFRGSDLNKQLYELVNREMEYA